MIHKSNVLTSDMIVEDAEDAQQATANTTHHPGVDHQCRGNNQQEKIQQLFKDYMMNEEDNEFPFSYLLTRAPGMGKSFAMELLQDLADNNDDIRPVKTFAQYGITVINVGGATLSSIIKQPIPEKDEHNTKLVVLNAKTLSEFCEQLEYYPHEKRRSILLIVINEISTVSPVMLAVFNAWLKQATGIDAPFGKIPILFVGDFCQLPLVGSISIARGIMELKIADKKFKACASQFRKATGCTHVPRVKGGKYDEASLFHKGCNLLASC